MSTATGTTMTSSISSNTNGDENKRRKLKKIQETALVQTVTTTLWKKAKFVYDDEDLDYGETISNIVLNDVQLLPQNRVEYWEWAKWTTKKALNSKRNTVCTTIKKCLVGKSNNK